MTENSGTIVSSLQMALIINDLLVVGVAMFICNFEPFGYIVKPVTYSTVEKAADKFVDFKLETLGKGHIHAVHTSVDTAVWCSLPLPPFPSSPSHPLSLPPSLPPPPPFPSFTTSPPLQSTIHLSPTASIFPFQRSLRIIWDSMQ